MHVLLLVLSVLGAAAIWFYRIRMIGGAAKGAWDAAHSAKGFVARKRRAARSDFSVITAIDSPPAAAATWLRLRMDRFEWEGRRDDVRAFLAEAAGPAAADEALTYAEWAATQGVDRASAVRTLRDQLEEWLDQDELAALDRVANDAPKVR